jgi:hypothetical protein
MEPSKTIEQTNSGNRAQISLGSILWTMAALAALLGYSKNLNQSAMVLLGCYCAFVLLSVLVAVALRAGWSDSFFWASLISVLAFLAVAGGTLPDRSIGIGWGLVGAACGVSFCVRWPIGVPMGTLVSAFIGLASMIVVVLSSRVAISQLMWFDIGCAAIVGAILRPSILFLDWFQKKSHMPRMVLSAWLCLSVMGGNLLVPILTGAAR